MRLKQIVWTQRAHILVSTGLLLGSLYFGHPMLTGSILLGFLIVFADFCLLKRAVVRMAEREVPKLRLALLFMGKYLVLMAVLGVSIFYFDLHLMGLLIGISTLIVAIVLFALKEGLHAG